MMNAIQLSILIHYYMYSEPYHPSSGTPRLSPSEIEAFKYLHSEALLDKVFTRPVNEYKISERGRVHVKALLEVSFPSHQWVSPLSLAK